MVRMKGSCRQLGCVLQMQRMADYAEWSVVDISGPQCEVFLFTRWRVLPPCQEATSRVIFSWRWDSFLGFAFSWSVTCKETPSSDNFLAAGAAPFSVSITLGWAFHVGSGHVQSHIVVNSYNLSSA